MKELDCEYMVDERTALAEAQEKNKRECGRSRALVGHDQMGIRPRSGSYVDSQIILGKVSSLRPASSSGKYKEHGRPKHLHAITSCEVEVSLFL
jgi:hypothetical protein